MTIANEGPLAQADLLKFEKELLGFYITSHPLTEHQSNAAGGRRNYIIGAQLLVVLTRSW